MSADEIEMDQRDVREASVLFFYLFAFISTTIGIVVVFGLNVFTPFSIFQTEFYHITHGMPVSEESMIRHLVPRAAFLIVTAFSTALLGVHLLLRPVRDCLARARERGRVSGELHQKAKRRLLNLPFMYIPVSVGLWIVIPFISFSTAVWFHQFDLKVAVIVFIRASMIGLVVSMIAYQRMENFSRKKLIPLFFPAGRLVEEQHVTKLTISKRIRTLNRFGQVTPILILFATLITLQLEVETAGVSAKDYGNGILQFLVVLCLYFLASTHVLNKSVSKSISSPIQDIIRVLKNIRNQKYDRKVQVVSNDEIGYAGDVINEMMEGLIQRETMQHSLNLAKEVQQNLLPDAPPQIGGFQIFGRSLYCDETGGDYFDYLTENPDGRQSIGIVAGDVSGHGIASALLMATARGVLRQRFALPGTLSDIIRDVNRLVCKDVKDSGSFMTLFFLVVAENRSRIRWIRAGHDPAVLYDPETGTFKRLKGRGMAIGLDPEARYEENEITDLQKGQIILLATDGVYETRNLKGRMFGIKGVENILLKHADKDARTIVEKLFEALDRHIDGAPAEDDATIVALKYTGRS
jgi:serine phosphatase RsbU (regulator of sigma subunit)